jgi:hypothetical protein
MGENKRYKYETPFDTYSVWLEKHTYANGRPALILVDEEGQVACATVNLPEHALSPGDVHVKTWSENEKMLPFLIKNKIVHDLGQDVPTGYVTARVCKLLI